MRAILRHAPPCGEKPNRNMRLFIETAPRQISGSYRTLILPLGVTVPSGGLHVDVSAYVESHTYVRELSHAFFSKVHANIGTW